jgi:hypothetical protein
VREYGLGVVDLLFWPISRDPINGANETRCIVPILQWREKSDRIGITKKIKGVTMTPYEFILNSWKNNSVPFRINPLHYNMGLHTQENE